MRDNVFAPLMYVCMYKYPSIADEDVLHNTVRHNGMECHRYG